MLRQEVYALDGTDKAEHSLHRHRAELHDSSNCSRRMAIATRSSSPTPAKPLAIHYERNPDDPRVSHALTLEVDGFGNVLKSAAIGYGRRPAGPGAASTETRPSRPRSLVTYTENGVTNPIDDPPSTR